VVNPAKPAATPAAKPAATPAAAPASFDKVILTIGDTKITAGEYEQLVDSLPEQFRAAARGPNKRQFAEQLVRIRILADEAKRRKLDQSPAIQRQVELQKDNLLANALFQEISTNVKVDNAAARQYFDQHKSEYESVHASHILIRMKESPVPLRPGKKDLTEDEALAKAQEVRKKLVAGEDFATLAKAESDDAGSGAKGGDLGTFKHGQMVPQFEQAAYALPVGQLSEPVKTQFGYHIIKVEQHDTTTFDEARPDLEKRLRPELARAAVENFRKQAVVTLDEGFFGPAAPAPSPAVPAAPAQPGK
jgi:peptidyl-prolyl cis-trans isomerase C